MSHRDDGTSLAQQLARREVSPTDLIEQTLARIDAHNDTLGAFVHVDAEGARSRAAQMTQQIESADEDVDLPPFFGLPIPIKDLAQVAGMPYEAGSAALAGNIADVDDGVVSQIRAAGANIVGKTATCEFGISAYTEPSIGQPALSPWDHSRGAGGSSGGAAAAVAAGLVPAAHGTDGGGSLRIPASSCGIVGMVPTRGRISRGPHSLDGAALAQEGVMTRSVRDMAGLLDALMFRTPGDTYLAPPLRTTLTQAVSEPHEKLRIGVITDPFNLDSIDLHPGALAAVERATDLAARAGHEIVSAPRPFDVDKWASFGPLWAVMAATMPLPPDSEDKLEPISRWMRDQGRQVDGLSYAHAILGIQALSREAARRWSDLDVILTPTLSGPPAKVGAMRNDEDPAADFELQKHFSPWTSSYNILGAPAISVPLHRQADTPGGPELPFGVMLGALPGGDDTILGLAGELEAMDPWPVVAPGYQA